MPFPPDNNPEPSRLKRIWHKLCRRWHWRATRSRYSRLTIVSQFFPPDFAATGQLLDDLTARLAARGLQVQVLTGMPAYAFTRRDARRIEFQPNRCIRRTQASRFWPQRISGRAINGILFCCRITLRLLRYSRRGDLILYTTEPPYLPLLGWLLHKLTRTPFIVLLYDLYPDVLVELGVLPAHHWLVRLWRHFNRWVFADAQELIVLSGAMAERVSAQAPAASGKLNVIPSWADPEQIRPRPKPDNWFVRIQQLEGCFTVLYSGNQGRCHDLVTVLAAALLLRHDPEVVFLFIGKGPQHQRLLQLVHDWGLDNCRFLPYQELQDLPFSLAAADLALVTLSIEAEGLVAPSKLYGHLAVGTPIAAITPANSYLRQLVEQEGCGRWFANGDAEALTAWIRELKANPDQAAACGRAARDLLERTATPEIVTARYLQLIERHLPEHKPLVRTENGQPEPSNPREGAQKLSG
ncbi:glycosyltransferase family 4 protein [Cyanobium sp. ATX 6A2]|uniref:glycosyltransferase family 4 protein n=1 Tax=Cyanobium sp. ATX 6A2 TaxID=2823700 RepID=UPI0020CBA355|nr:glycosyltransferase family 4 protein [Cyanobium sp. ATX 6A2]MCP9888956.1 glycosyltransferase family 4 protein [Cyanobium sp. ATX 6A2]